MNLPQDTQTDNQRTRLNRLYRFQRHFYDLTRRYFLFGRDRLLRQMNVQPGELVLEVGCGTGRNLLRLSQFQPKAKLFGLDASDEMLKTAAAKFDAKEKQKEIVLRQALAEEFSFQETYGLDRPFDKIFISYSLSMFPEWQKALLNGVANIKQDGHLYIVDFWDGSGLPFWFNKLLRKWLALFKVYYRPDFLEFLHDLQARDVGRLTVTGVGNNYAFIAHLELNGNKGSSNNL